MEKLRAAAYAGLRKGLSRPGSATPRKKKKKPRQLSAAELARLRGVLARQKASEALY